MRDWLGMENVFLSEVKIESMGCAYRWDIVHASCAVVFWCLRG
jgi:hypothetical protein